MSQHYTFQQYKRDAVITWLFFVAAILLSLLSAIGFFLAWLRIACLGLVAA